MDEPEAEFTVEAARRAANVIPPPGRSWIRAACDEIEKGDRVLAKLCFEVGLLHKQVSPAVAAEASNQALALASKLYRREG